MAPIFTALTVLLAALLHVLPGTQAFLSSTPVTLSTTHGDVNGAKKSVGTGLSMVEVFYGIPFAEPPVQQLRFRAPVPKQPWSEIDGTVMPKACWQAIDTAYDRFSGVDMWNPNTGMDEDCLYLNVWRPESSSNSGNSFPGSGDGDSSSSASSHKTIMVWIFGGAFNAGSPVLNVYDPSQLAVRNDVIVVTIGYRVGALGFMYLGNEEVSGNAGLLDQAMALQWVKDNAINLGGSPDDITLFGESAGAASVGFHLFAPLSRSLFTNAIMQSTSPLAEWAVMDTAKALDRAKKLATLVNCGTVDTFSVNYDSILSCLQTVDPVQLADGQWGVANGWFDVTFGPVVDGTFLPDHPANMLAAGNVKMTNVILGVNKDEGIYFDLYGFYNVFSNLSHGGQMTDEEFQYIMLNVAENNPSFKEQLINTYSQDEGGNRLDIVDAASGDLLFKCSVVDFAREYTRLGGHVYMYSFEENYSSNPWPDWMGVPHGYEIEVVFGHSLAPSSLNTLAEKELSLEVMGLWTNFAKTGSPNSDNQTQWPMYSSENAEYVIIDANGLRTEERLRWDQCQMWSTRHDQVSVPASTPVDEELDVEEEPGYTILSGHNVIGASSNDRMENLDDVRNQNVVVDNIVAL